MKIIIAGGGTGGHIFPIIELINECAARKIEVLWLGTNRGLERKHKPDGCKLIEMNISGFRGKIKNVSDMSSRVKMDRYYFKNWSLILDFKIFFQTIFKMVRFNLS